MSSSPTETLIDVTMPQMGVSVAEGTVVEWRKQPGDWIEADEIIASISTDKIDTDVEAPATGRVQELIVGVGETVEVGTVLARIATDAKPGEAHVSEGRSSSGGTSDAAAAMEASGEAGELKGDTTVREQRGPRGARRYSPVVMRIAAEHDVDLEKIEGTGRGGRVRKQDVLAYVAGTDGEAVGRGTAARSRRCTSRARTAPTSRRRRRRASRALTPRRRPSRHRRPRAARRSPGCARRSAPACWSRCRRPPRAPRSSRPTSAGSRPPRAKTGFTYLPYIARATIDALKEHPALNATLEGDTLTTYDGVHLGVAVSLGTGGGLIVPVIRDAQKLSVEGLAARIKDVARRGRANELTPDEVRGGSFTITNPGASGSIIATPVINQPQVAILDTEAVVKRPVVITDELGNDSIAIRPMTYLCMSWDHRALDGVAAAQFLSALRNRLESWPA